MKFIQSFSKKILNKEVMLYLIFGVLTTVINFVLYSLFYYIFLNNILNEEIKISLSNLIAFIVAVLFAFITNKKIVFNSKTSSKKEYTKEIISFFIARILTYIIDTKTIIELSNLFIIVFMLNEKLSPLLAKFISNIIVIILNYLFSKFFIFKKKKL